MELIKKINKDKYVCIKLIYFIHDDDFIESTTVIKNARKIFQGGEKWLNVLFICKIYPSIPPCKWSCTAYDDDATGE